MDFNEYQVNAMRTAGTRNKDGTFNIEPTMTVAALGLCGGSGEFADLIKKCYYHGHKLDVDKLIKELGNVLWYAALAASGLGFSLQLVAELNIEKLKARYPEGFSPERSVNREENKNFPCDHGRPDYHMCPHCMGINRGEPAPTTVTYTVTKR